MKKINHVVLVLFALLALPATAEINKVECNFFWIDSPVVTTLEDNWGKEPPKRGK